MHNTGSALIVIHFVDVIAGIREDQLPSHKQNKYTR